MENQFQSDPAVFDSLAAAYDESFTATDLGHILRARVWRHLAKHYRSGQYILDLACGTGEDALWLAGRGLRVTALDGSAEMVRMTAKKVDSQGLGGQINVIHRSIQEFSLEPTAVSIPAAKSNSQPSGASTNPPGDDGDFLFDGALSNFGGLNVLENLAPVASSLAEVIKPGGRLILVPMGKICPWELGWYVAHGRPKTAFRRFGHSPSAKIAGSVIPVWYPTPGLIAREFEPMFRLIHVESLGLFLPPSYLKHLVRSSPSLFRTLNSLEMKIGRWTRGWGDHYIAVLEKN